MRIAVFPFETRRLDDVAGVYARQVPRLLSEILRTVGVDARDRSWTVRRGTQRAHILLEGPLPSDVIEEEAAAIGASHALLGYLLVSAEEARLQLSLAPSEALDEVWSWSGARHGVELHLLIGEAVAALLTQIGAGHEAEAAERALPSSFEALLALLLEQDVRQLQEASLDGVEAHAQR